MNDWQDGICGRYCNRLVSQVRRLGWEDAWRIVVLGISVTCKLIRNAHWQAHPRPTLPDDSDAGFQAENH